MFSQQRISGSREQPFSEIDRFAAVLSRVPDEGLDTLGQRLIALDKDDGVRAVSIRTNSSDTPDQPILVAQALDMVRSETRHRATSLLRDLSVSTDAPAAPRVGEAIDITITPLSAPVSRLTQFEELTAKWSAQGHMADIHGNSDVAYWLGSAALIARNLRDMCATDSEAFEPAQFKRLRKDILFRANELSELPSCRDEYRITQEAATGAAKEIAKLRSL